MSSKPTIKSVQLTSPHLRATLISQGAALKSLHLKRPGKADLPLVLDLGRAEAYRDNPPHVGAVVGRVAGRIAHGQFKIRARAFQLAVNENGHTLHGGPQGFGQVNWDWAGGSSFRLSSPNGDQGFPGRLEVGVVYSMPHPLTLRLELTAKVRQTTPVNLTHHPYWTLYDADVQIAGQYCQSVDQALIPTGGTDTFVPDLSGALDHCVQIDGQGFRRMARLDHRGQGFAMEVWSDASHCQVYNGRAPYLCLEPQCANDAPNQADVPTIMVKPGQIWQRQIEYRILI